MKILLIISLLALVGCRGCFADYGQRKAGVLKVCPTCTFVRSENTYYAVDTAKRPNIIYRVIFRNGGAYYKAGDVDELIRVN